MFSRDRIEGNLHLPLLHGWYGSHTVDGRNPAPVEVGRLSHYLPGLMHPKGGWEWDF